MSFSQMMGGLSLGLTRSSEDKERGRSLVDEKGKGRARSAHSAETSPEDDRRARSTSPFRIRRSRSRNRDPSPDIEAIAQSDAESDYDDMSRRIRPRTAFLGSEQSDDESTVDSDSDDDWSDDEFDPVTESNTEQNALVPAEYVAEPENLEHIQDPLGEGPNVVVPPEPYFPTTLNASSSRGARRRKSTRVDDPLPIHTSRPVFARDRCTIQLIHGDPEKVLDETGRKPKRYMVASDLSEESRYAVEWGIGTVLRDGDEMLIVTVNENESKVDPATPNAADRTTKLRSQQERSALAYILVRQATSLLQRTRLNVTVSCQSWHAKNARHMLLDIIDYVEPVMVIVGSRGLSQLKGILLGSTSHYLIQKSSVPIMVARRRLRRPPRRAAHLAPHRARVSLAQAGIDRVASKVDTDVAHMREELKRDEERRANEEPDQDLEGEPEEELVDMESESSSPLGTKVAG
ncbi:adenine nucleotide alpha hydrolases-like protein [Punctularia strigosozonata HHB-11173 SS5]|uniref:adenine nucleotide alpha hydrolases-like protein n=1 Tax=Punctularia strigosozonata (strain HHB-11173) TaxID=741275 RepID=UPI000441686C|nr:adenine nucleotide alpha hydrolases-like protein [Punctularia strigosozonata HHB-11173 SS5]EIN12751.1 adenine nucleotide alpha hydrolases-like protein [Punctularia strigosozonata HHB-11173 SS5]